jgi:flagellar biosynthesis/type III secretory pathway M-ring protein FliF/YscJ
MLHWMEFAIAMTAILVGGMIFIIPMLALMVRFAIKPLADSWAATRSGADGQAVARIERRQVALEESVREMERTLARLAEGAEFERALQEGESLETPERV